MSGRRDHRDSRDRHHDARGRDVRTSWYEDDEGAYRSKHREDYRQERNRDRNRYRSRSRDRRSRSKSREGARRAEPVNPLPQQSPSGQLTSLGPTNHQNQRDELQTVTASTREPQNIALDAELTPEEIQMMMAMGIPFGFDSTQGKKVEDEGANAGAVKVATTRSARQYMNRKGGFNRPLPAEVTGEKVRRD